MEALIPIAFNRAVGFFVSGVTESGSNERQTGATSQLCILC